MSDLETVRSLARGALDSLELSRERIDDLNVYPVPDGDTGTNLTLTMRGVVEALDASTAAERAAIAHEATRAALMSARGNSGVILSQIVRGAADELGAAGAVDGRVVARAFRGASDEAYGAVRKPVEGTMLTVIRALAEAAERSAHLEPRELLAQLVEQGEEAVARTPEQLDVLREAGVVDAGGAGLLELVRGLAAAAAGETLTAPDPGRPLALEAMHQELSRYRYCTTFVLEGDALDAGALEDELERLGDSLLVVGDRTALKVHVHTDDPGAALSLGTGAGAIAGVEIADMHRQTEQREERLLAALPGGARTGVVAVVAGEGNRRLFEDLGAERIVEGGQTMNPSTADLLSAVESVAADEVVLLPNNSNVVMAAEQAARVAARSVHVVPTESIPAGLAALVAFNGERGAEENAAAMQEALVGVATGEVTVASRDASSDGVAVRRGEYLGLLDGTAVASGPSFDDVARELLGRLLSEPRDVLTLLHGEGAPSLNGLVDELASEHPELELDVHEGGQPHYPLLLSAE
ncbi:MAG TPA: DAK2 domain-containing protein [Solirubrobacteraceae bacterium]|nr:DAK2 domain-containing protein [Solirubrobacteraceae bacterium]